MIDYILFGEFDINEGNVIKIEYPNKTGINEMVLASYLIPEGTHNIMNDSFCFIINRKTPNSEEILVKNLQTQMDKLNLHLIKYLDLSGIEEYSTKIKNHTFKLKEIYNYNAFAEDWESLKVAKNLSKSNQVNLIISQDTKEKFYNLVVYTKDQLNKDEILFTIPIHNDIQFRRLRSNFASFYTLNSQAIGFEFEMDQDLALIEKLFEGENVEIMTNRTDDIISHQVFSDVNTIINSEKEIYFLCFLETKLDKATKRGAILKSIAIGTTKLINLNSFKPLAKFLLEESFKIHTFNIREDEKMSLLKKSIETGYKIFNSIPPMYFGTSINHYERAIHSYLAANDYFYLKNEKNFEIELGGGKISIDLAIQDYEEKIFPSSIIELIKTFKENTMIIYDAILSDKKILFVGDNYTSCERLAIFVFSTMAMVTPLSVGIIKRIHPYKNLYDMEFLKSSNCIYAVTNPIFKSKNDAWDVMCEVDSGKISVSENYKKYLSTINRDTDHFFIKELLFKIKNEFISEYEVGKYFKSYTFHLLKITGDKYFIDDDELTNEVNKQYKRKIKLQNSMIWKIHSEFDKFKELINFNGRSLKLVERHLDNLYYRKNIDKEELILIYSDIDKFLNGGEFYANLVKFNLI
jgi:hypothetical protein